MAWFFDKSKNFNRVNSALLGLLQKAAEGSPYDVNAMSGFRAGDPRQHGRGNATDVQLIDRSTGKVLPNYQDATNFKAYQDYANRVYQAATPEQRKALRWGGYFSGKKNYGALDLMHFDLGSGLGMAGGSFEGGLTPQQAALWGLQAGGGVGGNPAATDVAAAPPDPSANGPQAEQPPNPQPQGGLLGQLAEAATQPQQSPMISVPNLLPQAGAPAQNQQSLPDYIQQYIAQRLQASGVRNG